MEGNLRRSTQGTEEVVKKEEHPVLDVIA